MIQSKNNILACVVMFVLSVSALVAQHNQAMPSQSSTNVPAGTELQVRLNQALSSDKAQVGERFTGVLVNSLYVNSSTSFPPGSTVEGRVITIKDSGRMSKPGEMELVVDTVRSGNMVASVNVNPYTVKGRSHTGSNVGKTTAGAGIGAVIGAIAGGGKGAAIGAGAGGAAGAGTAAATGKKPAKINVESVLSFFVATESPVIIQQTQPGNTHNAPMDPPDLTGDAGPRQEGPLRSGSPNLSRRPAREMPNSGVTQDNNQSFNPQTIHDIQNCFNTRADDIPASFIRKDHNAPPSGYARGDLLSADDMDRARMLPDVCASAAPKLSSSRMIVVLNAQVMLLNSAHRVLDVFGVQ